jgi:hypothetical protein
MRHYPKISFVTATYARPPAYLWLLEEVAECFRRNAEDYPGECEWVLLNDCAAQTLVCDLPGVKVINHPTRFASLGEKLNYAIEQATGELILPQDDDDISLPWRARLSEGRRPAAGQGYWNPRSYWFMHPETDPDHRNVVVWLKGPRDAGGMATGYALQHEQRTGYAHNCSAFTKAAWKKAGRYPPLCGPQDAELDGAFRRLALGGKAVLFEGPLTAEEDPYIYRWSVSNLHLSAFHPHEAEKYAEIGRQPVTPGVFKIEPRWQADYVELTRKACGAPPNSGPTAARSMAGIPWRKP